MPVYMEVLREECWEEEMESQIKSGNSETANGYRYNKSGGEDIYRINGVSSRKRTLFVVAFILRLLAFGTTFCAAIVMGTDKQTVILPQVGPWPAKYQYTPAFVFFVLGNAIACGYTVLSLIFTLIGKHVSALSVFLLFLTDLLMLVLVSAATAAATAVASVARHGNSHTQWRKVCGVYEHFCNRGAVAIFSSFAGVFNFMALTVVSTYLLYRRARCAR